MTVWDLEWQQQLTTLNHNFNIDRFPGSGLFMKKLVKKEHRNWVFLQCYGVGFLSCWVSSMPAKSLASSHPASFPSESMTQEFPLCLFVFFLGVRGSKENKGSYIKGRSSLDWRTLDAKHESVQRTPKQFEWTPTWWTHAVILLLQVHASLLGELLCASRCAQAPVVLSIFFSNERNNHKA